MTTADAAKPKAEKRRQRHWENRLAGSKNAYNRAVMDGCVVLEPLYWWIRSLAPR